MPHGTAQHRASRLHPSRRTPWRGKQKQIRIHLSRLAQHGKNVGLIVRDGESLHLRIGLALVVAEHLGRVVARPDARPANVQPHLRRMKQFMKQTLPCRRLEAVERVARRIGESRAEAEHVLKLFARDRASTTLFSLSSPVRHAIAGAAAYRSFPPVTRTEISPGRRSESRRPSSTRCSLPIPARIFSKSFAS